MNVQEQGKTIVTICARGGSKGLPRKNLLPFAGKPLIAHTIEHALACSGIEGVYVSTDDEEIAEVAINYGAIVPYLRPSELATDSAGKLPVIEHLVKYLEAEGLNVARIVDLQPTSPLRLPQDILDAMALFATTADCCDLVVSVTEPSHNPYYALAEERVDGTLCLSKPANALRRQDVPRAWGLNGAIYIWHREALPKAIRDGFWQVTIRPSVMPRSRSLDIDERLDFDMAEWLYHRQNSNNL